MKRDWIEINKFFYELSKLEPVFQLQIIKLNDKKDRIASRRVSWDEIKNLGFDNEINVSASGKWNFKYQDFLLEVNQISNLRNYIVLDLDLEVNESKEDLKLRFEKTLSNLKALDIKGVKAVKTSSNGYHIAIYVKDLFLLSEIKREAVKQLIITKFEGEISKFRDNSNISLDIFFNKGNLTLNHWKTNLPVELIEEIDGHNTYRDLELKFKDDFYKLRIDETRLNCLQLLSQGSETRNEVTEILSSFIKDTFSIKTIRGDDKSEILIYKNGIHINDGKSYIKESIRNILGQAYTTQLSNLVIDKIEVDTYVNDSEFYRDNNPEEICIRNGILNIKTKELTPHTPDKIFFTKVNYKYNPKRKPTKFLKVLKSILKYDEDEQVLGEIFGHCLFRDYYIQKAIMFTGGGRNGKGVLITILKMLLGEENCTNLHLDRIEKDNFALGELHNKLVNIGADINNTALKDTAIFKSLTGKDLVTAPRKFLPSVSFVNYAKMIFSANTLPMSYDNTSAFWNRWVLLEFPYTFVSEKEFNLLSNEEKKNKKLANPNIIDEIVEDEDEMSGILNWALEGLDRLLKQKDYSYNKSVNEVKMLWTRKSNSFKAFFMDVIEEDFDSKIKKSDLRRAYALYCKHHRLKLLSDKVIKNSLEETGVSESRFRGHLPNEFNVEKYLDEMVWEGIKFKFDKGVKDDTPISPLYEKMLFSILGINTIDTLDKSVKNNTKENNFFLNNQKNIDESSNQSYNLQDILEDVL